MNIPHKSYFWSYEKDNIPDHIVIEQILKYGDVSEIKELIKEFGSDICLRVWQNKIIPDLRFSRLNYFLARFIFKISEDKVNIITFLKNHQKARFEKQT